jgi:hypothetical protein
LIFAQSSFKIFNRVGASQNPEGADGKSTEPVGDFKTGRAKIKAWLTKATPSVTVNSEK